MQPALRTSMTASLGLVLLSTASTADAHLGLDSPPSRYGANVLKQPPCGRAGGSRSTNVTTFAPGETITVQWNEYINHPGHYRIAFDADGDDDFEDPACLSGCDSRNPTVEMYNNPSVLLDDIADGAGGNYTATVTLPNVECNNCTLQVIQVMYDKPPYTIPGNEMYYQCADLVLAGPAPADAGTPADAEARLDAAPTDGSSSDVLAAIDAGVPTQDAAAGVDTGVATNKTNGPGCRCVETSAAPWGLLLSAPLVLLSLRRRRFGSSGTD